MDKLDKNQKIVLGIGIAIVFGAIVFYGLGFQNIIDPGVPLPPGPGQKTFKTEIVLDNPISPFHPSHPDIKSVQSIIYYQHPESSQESEILLFPWGGTLKVTITYPSGAIVNKPSKDVSVDWGGSRTVYEYWRTSENGAHTVTAELYNGDGVLIDSKTEEVDSY